MTPADERDICARLLAREASLRDVASVSALDFADQQLGAVFAVVTACMEAGRLPTLERVEAVLMLGHRDVFPDEIEAKRVLSALARRAA